MSKKSHFFLTIVILISLLLFCAFLMTQTKAPSFSADSGFMEEPFLLELGCPPGSTVYYTLDGSEPTLSSPVYEEPILITDASSNPNIYSAIQGISSFENYTPNYPVTKGTVVKAMSVSLFGLQSETVSSIYFVNYANQVSSYNVMLLSAVVDPEDFFSEETGIYMLGDTFKNAQNAGLLPDESRLFPANYRNRGKDWERTAMLTLFDTTHQTIFAGPMGMRIHGNWSRSYNQKGFGFHPQSRTDLSFPFGEYVLRTGGTYSSMLRDAFVQSLVTDRKLATQQTIPCVLYLNGEYWGLYNLTQRFSESYFANQYHISSDNLICIKTVVDDEALYPAVHIGGDSDFSFYEELENFALENDLSIPENYERISQMMDIQSYIDYISVECYVANSDWPYNNYCCFRTRSASASPYADGLWYWALYDLDDCATTWDLNYYTTNPFTEEGHWEGSVLEEPLFSGLMKNPDFRKQFTLSFMDIANVNFQYENTHEKLMDMAAVYQPHVIETRRRFLTNDTSPDFFLSDIADIDSFFEHRREYAAAHLADAFSLEGELKSVFLSANLENAGEVQINTSRLPLTCEEWEGKYFSDYPIQITALPAEGFRFVRWEGSLSSGDPAITVPLNEDVTLKAVFEKTE